MDLINNYESKKDITHPYKLFTKDDFIKINHIQALKLELKLNLSTHSRNWIKLGDTLYKWRIDTSIYEISIPLEYMVSFEQLEWIRQNL